MVEQVDRTVGYLRDRVRQEGLEHRLNLIITSDHGMATVNKQAPDLVELHKVPNFSFQDIYFELVDYGPNGMLYPKEGKLDKVYEALKDAHPKLHVYKKESFPKELHYANHSRITPLVMYSDPGYVIHGVSSRRPPQPPSTGRKSACLCVHAHVCIRVRVYGLLLCACCLHV